jgi:hypothetical protein
VLTEDKEDKALEISGYIMQIPRKSVYKVSQLQAFHIYQRRKRIEMN